MIDLTRIENLNNIDPEVIAGELRETIIEVSTTVGSLNSAAQMYSRQNTDESRRYVVEVMPALGEHAITALGNFCQAYMLIRQNGLADSNLPGILNACRRADQAVIQFALLDARTEHMVERNS